MAVDILVLLLFRNMVVANRMKRKEIANGTGKGMAMQMGGKRLAHLRQGFAQKELGETGPSKVQ